MTEQELNRFINALASNYDRLAAGLSKPAIRKAWEESFESANVNDVRTALTQWITNNPSTREPTVNDLALLTMDIRDKRVKQEAEKNVMAAIDRIQNKKVPTSIDNPLDKVWVEFHLHWTNKGLNQGLSQLNREGKRNTQTQFPWSELIHAYRELAEEYPGLSNLCERAISSIVNRKQAAELARN